MDLKSNDSMKNSGKIATGLVLLAAVFMAFSPAKPQEKSKLKYFEGTFEEALEKAKAENKPLFIEGYTSWCGWCKELDKRTFSDQEVADFMNTHFVNVKMDMETEEGRKVAEKYRVRGYPTMLFLYHNANVLHRIDGFVPAKSMLTEAESAKRKFDSN